MLIEESLGLIDEKTSKKGRPWRPAFIVTGGHMALAFEFWSKIFFTNAVQDKNEFYFYKLKWLFIKMPTKQEFLLLKAKKAN